MENGDGNDMITGEQTESMGKLNGCRSMGLIEQESTEGIPLNDE